MSLISNYKLQEEGCGRREGCVDIGFSEKFCDHLHRRWRSKRKEKVASASGGDGAPNVETERISPSRKATEDADEEFDFVEADFYEREAQPFSLGATRGALLLMDFHAHLTEDEVIGFLAGTYDADDTSIRVVDTFPCRSLPADDQDHSISVEMDPTSEVEVRREILVGMEHNRQRR